MNSPKFNEKYEASLKDSVIHTFAMPREESTMNIKERPSKKHHLPYWTTYFNFGFYVGIIPFRFKENPSSGKLEISENRCQKVFVAITNALALFARLEQFRLFFLKSTPAEPIQYVQILQMFSELTYTLLFIFVYWTRKSYFSSVFDKLQQPVRSEKYYDVEQSKSSKIFAFGGCIFFVFISQNIIIANFTQNGWTLSPLLKKYKDRVNVLFSLKEETEPQFLLPGLVFMCEMLAEFILQYLELLVWFTIMVFHHLATEFQKTLKNEQNLAAQVLTSYEELKEIFEVMNRAVRPFVIVFLISSLPFYVQVFTGIKKMDSFLPFVFFAYSIYFLCLTASTNKKMNDLKEWIQKRCQDISQTDLLILLNELTPRSNIIGLNVGGLFCINYNFLGSLAGLLLTYVVVVVQMKSSNLSTSQPANDPASFCLSCSLTCPISD